MVEHAVLEGPPSPAGDAGPALHVVSASPAPSPAPPRLEISRYDLGTAFALERELGVSHALAQVLVRRGFSDAARAAEFLNPSEAYEPTRFAGITDATRLIESHLRARTRITVHGDYDVDGVCATAIMVRALRALGANVGWFLPDRIDDGYGLSAETVRRLGSRGTELLVTVDCAITAVDEVSAARQLGMDVVVSDHHAPRADGLLPDCAIVHPLVGGYPCPELCGTAVAYKLAQALGADTAEQDIELVALATVADLMPLTGENRRLVRAGLAALANTARPGLRALMRVAKVDPSALDASALGFRLAPRINAAGRLRRADAGLELLLTGEERRAMQIAHELDALNSERRAVEQRITWEAEAQLGTLGERPAYVLAGEDWHPGVIGIVASRIAERYHRPAFLVSLDGELATGSARSIPGFDLLASLDAAAAHLERYGGHRAAAGFTIRSERLAAFRDAVESYARELLSEEVLQPLERVDAIVSGCELGLDVAEELELLEPCGIGNPGPRLLVPGARFGDPRPMGDGRHLRFSVTSGGARARAVAFGCDGRLGVDEGEPADASFRLQRNVWNGAVEARVVLRHVWPCAPPPIQVLAEGEDYLACALDELEAPYGTSEQDGTGPHDDDVGRTTLDRRGESSLAVLADARSAGEVLAVCADVQRRLAGLGARIGGFALIGYHALERQPQVVDRYEHVVALDPPAGVYPERLLRRGNGFAHLCWGDAELRFAQQMHELEFGLRASLAALYRSLRLRGRVTGEELERLLRGDGPHPRPARLAGRLIRILTELELVSLDPDLPALEIAGTESTTLERSATYRVCLRRYEDGWRYLKSASLQHSG